MVCWGVIGLFLPVPTHHCLLNSLRQRNNKMAAFSQTTLSNAFSWMEIFEFRLKIHWSLFLRVQLTIFQHWFRWWLGASQAASHYLNQWWLVYWRIYASLGLIGVEYRIFYTKTWVKSIIWYLSVMKVFIAWLNAVVYFILYRMILYCSRGHSW